MTGNPLEKKSHKKSTKNWHQEIYGHAPLPKVAIAEGTQKVLLSGKSTIKEVGTPARRETTGRAKRTRKTENSFKFLRGRKRTYVGKRRRILRMATSKSGVPAGHVIGTRADA